MNIKAYAWDDEDYGGSYFVWTTTPGKAKALLAAEHDREFTEIRVYRVPWADKYGDNINVGENYPQNGSITKLKVTENDIEIEEYNKID